MALAGRYVVAALAGSAAAEVCEKRLFTSERCRVAAKSHTLFVLAATDHAVLVHFDEIGVGWMQTQDMYSSEGV